MVEVVFMRASVFNFHSLQCCQLRENEWKQSASVKVYETFRRNRGEQYLVQLVGYAFFRNNIDAFPVSLQRIECFVFYVEIKLSGESYAAHHAQRVVAERDVRV